MKKEKKSNSQKKAEDIVVRVHLFGDHDLACGL